MKKTHEKTLPKMAKQSKKEPNCIEEEGTHWSDSDIKRINALNSAKMERKHGKTLKWEDIEYEGMFNLLNRWGRAVANYDLGEMDRIIKEL